ncbi:MAG TPA: helix-turn-helix domain-containing protein, partial [Saprospiraceae bacterium]|nr:helix-turn-helix domain-containing protein [Saprospiraceae bacterium]
MILKDFLPIKGLKWWIKCYRIEHFKFDTTFCPPPKPYTPRPEQCLAFYPLDCETVDYPEGNKSIKNTRVALIGQHNQTTLRSIGNHFMVVQVIFQPGALYRILGIPLSELVNAYLDADTFFGPNIHLINEQIFHALHYNDIVNILDNNMMQIISSSKNLSSNNVDAVINIINTAPSQKLDLLAQQSFYSYKQFDRNFQLRTGLSPRYYQRIVRFDNAFRIRNFSKDLSWQALAWDANYTDYQHLVKDYKEFTGLSP